MKKRYQKYLLNLACALIRAKSIQSILVRYTFEIILGEGSATRCDEVSLTENRIVSATRTIWLHDTGNTFVINYLLYSLLQEIPGRYTDRRKPENIQKLKQSFDGGKFNFQKVSPKEVRHSLCEMICCLNKR